MSPPERLLHPERSALARFGYELRKRRKALGLSQAKFGTLVHVSGDLVQKIECGDRRPGSDFAERCDRAFGAQGALVLLWEEAEAEAHLSRHADDADSASVGIARPLDLAPPLLASGMMAVQTSSPAELDVSVPARTGLAADASRSRSRVNGEIVMPCRTIDGRIIWVSVPRRAFLVGGIGAVAAAATGSAGRVKLPSAAGTRLANLYSYGESPLDYFRQMRIVLRDSDNLFGPRRVMPMVHEQLMTMHDLGSGVRGTDRQRLFQVQAEFADLLAWLHQDSGNHEHAQYWLDRALDWSHIAGSAEGVAFILARKSQLAGDMHDASQAIDVAEAAMRHAQPRNMRAASIAATYAAHGHALQADKAACQREYDYAYELLAKVEDDPSATYGLFLNEAYIEAQRAHSFAILGDYATAFQIFDDAIKALPASYHRDRGVYLIRKALACAHAASAGTGDVSENANEAANAGLQSLAIGTETNSVRIVTGLVALASQLKPWTTIPHVAEFRSAMKDLEPMLISRTADRADGGELDD